MQKKTSAFSQKLPDFFIIGAMKAGTTSLYRYLRCHPDIHMPKVKEPNFFAGREAWEKGLKWYTELFESGFSLTGEASTAYTKYPAFSGVAERIRQAVPHAKFIYLLRDPVERLISHYRHNVLSGNEKRSFEEAVQPLEDSHYVCCSRYAFQLDQYRRLFRREQILLIDSHKLKYERQNQLVRVFNFLGADASFNHPDFEQEFHTTAEKAKSDLPSVDIRASLREGLKNIFQEDIARLKRLTGETFDTWDFKIRSSW